jgi:serine/threonine protein kinase
MENKDHLDAELKARKRADGEDRFDKEYVIAALGHHNGDKDPEFWDATEEFNLPKYCLVLEQGERSLGDAILNENISRNLLRVRPCLEELAKALEHIHECGYVHCDVKPKNAIREVAPPRKWLITDFDSTTKKGEPMGKKVSTGYLAPELVSMKDGRPVLRCLCVFDDAKRISIARVPVHASDGILCKDEVAVAHESIDAWSFGCVAYLLITGEPLIGEQDVYDNLDGRGLRYLANWNDWALMQALKKVYDPTASDLLQGLLHPDPGKRPSMADTLKHPFFHPDEEAVEKEKLRQNKDVGDLFKRELQMFQAAQDKKLGEIAAGITEFSKQLQTYQRVTLKMLAKILTGGIVPRYMCLVPDEVRGQMVGQATGVEQAEFLAEQTGDVVLCLPCHLLHPKR